MNKYLALLIVALMVTVTVPVVCDESSAASGGIVIAELDPYNEGFSLYNSTSHAVDLKGYYATDGEGTLTISSSKEIAAGAYMTFVKAKGTDFFTSRTGTIIYGTSGTSLNKSLDFSNTKDELALYSSTGALVDSVCYGSSPGVDGWTGSPVSISSGHYLLRYVSKDTDSAADWIATKPGWTNIPFDSSLRYDAKVTPFTFPESNGALVLSALSEATVSIDISIYLVNSKSVAALLADRAQNGVAVRVLYDGHALGIDTTSERSQLKAVVDAGGEVKIINDGSGGRYSYVHNKYAVIDNDTVVITSENWTGGNIGTSGNRGWGAVIESAGYAHYMETIFANDYSTDYGDVVAMMEAYPQTVTETNGMKYTLSDVSGYSTYTAQVTPAMSPDNSMNAQRWFMSTATSTLYVEEMDLSEEFSSTTGDTPVAWMADAASRGVEVRFILDASQSSKESHVKYVNDINDKTTIKAVTVDGFKDGTTKYSLIHNKGIIADDAVWVGSVNWTKNSFVNNRESAVIIYSAEVASYYRSFFMKDYGVTVDTVKDNGLQLRAQTTNTTEGRVTVVSAIGPDDYEYTWDLGNGTVRNTTIPKVVFTGLAVGDYKVKVTIKGDGLTAEGMTQELSFNVSESSSSDNSTSKDNATSDWMTYVIPIVIVILGLFIAVLKAKGKNNARRGRKHGR